MRACAPSGNSCPCVRGSCILLMACLLITSIGTKGSGEVFRARSDLWKGKGMWQLSVAGNADQQAGGCTAGSLASPTLLVYQCQYAPLLTWPTFLTTLPRDCAGCITGPGRHAPLHPLSTVRCRWGNNRGDPPRGAT